jgi:hypothetical protein
MEDYSTSHCSVSEDEEIPTKTISGSTLRSRAASVPQIQERQQSLFVEPKPLVVVMANEKSSEEPFSDGVVVPLDIADFECSLCFRLFCKPVTTSCGHTYCK